MRFQLPGWMIGRKRFRFLTPTLFHGWTRCQPLKTIVMKWAAAFERITFLVMRQGDVSHFWVKQAVHKLAIHDCAASDACANSNIHECVQALCRTPKSLAQCCAIDIQ